MNAATDFNHLLLRYKHTSWGVDLEQRQLFPGCKITQNTEREMIVEYPPNTINKALVNPTGTQYNLEKYTGKSAIEIKSAIQAELTATLSYNNAEHIELSFLETHVHNNRRGGRYSYHSLNSTQFATVVKVLYPSVTTRYNGRQLDRQDLAKAIDGLVPRYFGIKNLDTLMYIYARLLLQNNRYGVKGEGVKDSIDFTIDGIAKFITKCGGVIDGKIGVRKNFNMKEKEDGQESK
jgi:hypothetical protein